MLLTIFLSVMVALEDFLGLLAIIVSFTIDFQVSLLYKCFHGMLPTILLVCLLAGMN